MKQILKPSQVSYNPKTDEYTVDNDLYFLGILHNTPIYCEKTGYGFVFLIEKFLGITHW